MERKKFESELGDVVLRLDMIERPQREGDWSRIRSDFSEEELADLVRFRELRDVELDRGNYFSVLKLKTDDWKRMFFMEGEASELFKDLKYYWRVYRQNHPG